jgi:hypothetical protein
MAGIQIKEIQAFPYFHISQMSGSFLCKKKRNEVLDSHILA